MSRRASPTPAADLRVVAYEDIFVRSDAPYHLEERISASGRSYSVKVYEREAYTADHMVRSGESGRLVRWAVRLSDGSAVSHDGALRLLRPGAWAEVKPRVARLRGGAREAALAEALWAALSPDERGAMLASVDLDAYADGRGERAASAAVVADLRASGSALAFAPVPWLDLVRDRYAARHLGGAVGSAAWRSAPWRRWVAYVHERAGAPHPDPDGPSTIVGVEAVRGPAGRTFRPSAWWHTLWEFFVNAQGERAAEAPHIADALWSRLGGHPLPEEAVPPERIADLEARRRALALRQGRMRRVDPALAGAHAGQAPSYDALEALTGAEFLASMLRAIPAPGARKANARVAPGARRRR